MGHGRHSGEAYVHGSSYTGLAGHIFSFKDFTPWKINLEPENHWIFRFHVNLPGCKNILK